MFSTSILQQAETLRNFMYGVNNSIIKHHLEFDETFYVRFEIMFLTFSYFRFYNRGTYKNVMALHFQLLKDITTHR